MSVSSLDLLPVSEFCKNVTFIVHCMNILNIVTRHLPVGGLGELSLDPYMIRGPGDKM